MKQVFNEIMVNNQNITKIIKSSIITSGIKFAMSTGNWGGKNNFNKQGVAQVLSRLTINSTKSHLRRVNTPVEKNGKLIGPRKLHNTQWMRLCPCESPEGASIGVVKNLSVCAKLTHYINNGPLLNIINNLDYIQNIDDVPVENIKGSLCDVEIKEVERDQPITNAEVGMVVQMLGSALKALLFEIYVVVEKQET